jgi:hypothetical protein
MEYFLHRDGQQWGPYDEATLRSMLAAQQVLPTDLIWNEQLPCHLWRSTPPFLISILQISL